MLVAYVCIMSLYFAWNSASNAGEAVSSAFTAADETVVIEAVVTVGASLHDKKEVSLDIASGRIIACSPLIEATPGIFRFQLQTDRKRGVLVVKRVNMLTERLQSVDMHTNDDTPHGWTTNLQFKCQVEATHLDDALLRLELEEAKEVLYRHTHLKTYRCDNLGTLANTNGWMEPENHYCMDGLGRPHVRQLRAGVANNRGLPSRPCVVLSFGIADIWDFDDRMLEIGCLVYSFDPSMKSGHLKRTAKHSFFPIGIDVFDGVRMSGESLYGDVDAHAVLSLSTIMQSLGHDYVDIIRLDVESFEWRLLEDWLKKGLLDNVGQLLIEIHMWEGNGASAIRRYGSVLKAIEASGFERFSTKSNLFDPYLIFDDPKKRECVTQSYEIAYFRTPDRPGAEKERNSVTSWVPTCQCLPSDTVVASQSVCGTGTLQPCALPDWLTHTYSTIPVASAPSAFDCAQLCEDAHQSKWVEGISIEPCHAWAFSSRWGCYLLEKPLDSRSTFGKRIALADVQPIRPIGDGDGDDIILSGCTFRGVVRYPTKCC